jgi:hypothetical protein
VNQSGFDVDQIAHFADEYHISVAARAARRSPPRSRGDRSLMPALIAAKCPTFRRRQRSCRSCAATFSPPDRITDTAT